MDKLKAAAKRHWPLIVILLATLVLYVHGLHGGFVDDDTAQITDNAHLNSFAYDLRPVYASNYHRPLMFMFFTVVDLLFGKNPFWFHLPQVAIFVASIVLIYALFNKFFGRKIATILSLVVALHPINVDTVQYISHVQDVLFMFFGLVALLVIDRWRRRPYWQLICILALLIFIATLSKENGLLWVPILVLYTYLFKRQLLKPVAIGLVGGALLYGLYVLLAPNADVATNGLFGPVSGLSFWQRQVSSPAILWFYMHTFLWPASLNIAYGWHVARVGSLQFWGPLLADLLFVTGMIGGAYYLKRRRPAKLHLYLFFVAWFAIGMLFLFQLWPLDLTVAERWFYLPMIGLLGAVGTLVSTLSWKSVKPIGQSFLMALLILSAGALLVRSYVRISNFSDNMNILRHDAQANETDYRIYTELGVLLERNHQYQEAGYYYQKSLDLQKEGNNAWAGLGAVSIDLNDTQSAEYYFAGSVQYDPAYSTGYYNLATLLLNENRASEAIKVLKQGLAKWPNDPGLQARMADAQKTLLSTTTSAATKR